MKKTNQTYLGDGVYAEFDGYQIWLTLLSGERIALEPHVIDSFIRYIEHCFNVSIKIDKTSAEVTNDL